MARHAFNECLNPRDQFVWTHTPQHQELLEGRQTSIIFSWQSKPLRFNRIKHPLPLIRVLGEMSENSSEIFANLFKQEHSPPSLFSSNNNRHRFVRFAPYVCVKLFKGLNKCFAPPFWVTATTTMFFPPAVMGTYEK